MALSLDLLLPLLLLLLLLPSGLDFYLTLFVCLLFLCLSLYFRWVSKDGIGALGRLLIGRETMGRLINVHGFI